MNDNISVFKGIKPKPISIATWQKALENIKSDRYKSLIEQARKIIKETEKYRKFKTTLPAITFSGTFEKRRNCKNILSPTGFIIPDLDHLKNLELIFDILTQDKNTWFAFRSPSGEGLKVGFRAQNIKDDKDHKQFYFAVERYFKEIYGIEIDPACKDISRLTFVSYDPELWINPGPQYFDIKTWTKPIAPPSSPLLNETDFIYTGKKKYARKVLESCCENIRQSLPGSQHYTRLKAARLIGGYLQYINEAEVIAALEQAVQDSGAKNMQAAMKTVRDGLEYGKISPIIIEDVQGYADNRYDDQRKVSVSDDISCDTCDTCDKVRQPATTCDKGATLATKSATPATVRETIGERNLAMDIHAFLSATTGSFTTDYLDRELGITTRLQKQRRSYILRKYIKKEYKNKCTEILLKKDPRRANTFYVSRSEMEWIDLEAEIPENFPIRLPFGLEEKVSIPPKSIIIVAGSTNSGKTAIVLNTLRLNMESSFEKLFLVSEGAGEIRGRIKSFGDSLSKWKDNVMIASQSCDFDTAIENYNTDGFTCIDYLEPPEGQYYLLTDQIRSIYDALNTGVAMIALQKHSASTIGRGGEGTAEKARLYMTVDYLCNCKRGIICALRLAKVKQSRDENMQNREIHFKIERGSALTPLTDWMLSSRVNREKLAKDYEAEESEKSDYAYKFKLVDGSFVGLNFRDRAEWVENFCNIDVDSELGRIQADSLKRPWMTKKNWFFQVAGLLDKKDRKNRPGEPG